MSSLPAGLELGLALGLGLRMFSTVLHVSGWCSGACPCVLLLTDTARIMLAGRCFSFFA